MRCSDRVLSGSVVCERRWSSIRRLLNQILHLVLDSTLLCLLRTAGYDIFEMRDPLFSLEVVPGILEK